MSANLTFLFPAAALIVFMAAMAGGSLGRLALRCVLPGAALCACLIAPPLSHAGMGNFYFGAKSAAESIESLVLFTFARPGARVSSMLWGYVICAAAAVVVAMGCAAAMERFRRKERDFQVVAALGSVVVGLVAALFVIAGHLGLKFHIRRCVRESG